MIFETDKIISALFPFCLLNTVNNPKLISSFGFFLVETNYQSGLFEQPSRILRILRQTAPCNDDIALVVNENQLNVTFCTAWYSEKVLLKKIAFSIG